MCSCVCVCGCLDVFQARCYAGRPVGSGWKTRSNRHTHIHTLGGDYVVPSARLEHSVVWLIRPGTLMDEHIQPANKHTSQLVMPLMHKHTHTHSEGVANDCLHPSPFSSSPLQTLCSLPFSTLPSFLSTHFLLSASASPLLSSTTNAITGIKCWWQIWWQMFTVKQTSQCQEIKSDWYSPQSDPWKSELLWAGGDVWLNF